MRKFLLYFFILLLLSALSFVFFYHENPVKFNSITVPKKFSISIPEYLIATDSIDPSSLLQYKNEKEQMFLLVREKMDTVQQPLETIFKKFSDDLISNMENGNLVKYFPVKINDHDAFIGNIRGSVNETGVYYRIAVIKSTDTMCFEIIIGTTDNDKSRYDEDMDKIIRGFEVY